MTILLPALLVASSLIHASASICPTNPTDVRVTQRITPPRIDASKTVDEMKAMRLSDAVTNDTKFTETAGITDASVIVNSEVRTASSGPENGPFCVWPSVVTVTLVTAPVVYVDASHGACRQANAVTHEMGHVEIDRQLIEQYSPIFRRRVAAMANAIGGTAAPDRNRLMSVRERIEDKFNAILSITLDEMNQERTRQQHAHNSIEEYQRLSSACRAVSLSVAPSPLQGAAGK